MRAQTANMDSRARVQRGNCSANSARLGQKPVKAGHVSSPLAEEAKVAITALLRRAPRQESPPFELLISIMPRRAGVLDNALDAVGHTPLIRLEKIARDAGLKCNLCMFIRLLGS